MSGRNGGTVTRSGREGVELHHVGDVRRLGSAAPGHHFTKLLHRLAQLLVDGEGLERAALTHELGRTAAEQIQRGAAGAHQTLSLSRVTFLSHSEADRNRKIQMAHDYYSRFDNVFTGPGIVENGMIKPLPRKMTVEQTAENLTICTPAEMVDKLAPYAEAGVDRFIMNINFGVEQSEVLESIQCFAEEVMPHFSDAPAARASAG